MFLNSKNLTYRADIEKLRPTMLPEDGFWIERETISIEDPGAIRILVCGNSGIGKSTLINEVFGTELVSLDGMELFSRLLIISIPDHGFGAYAWNPQRKRSLNLPRSYGLGDSRLWRLRDWR